MPRISISNLQYLLLGLFILCFYQIRAQNYDGNGDLKLSEQFINENRNGEAKALIQKVLALDNTNPRANVLLAKTYLADNDYASACKHFEIAYENDSILPFDQLSLYAKTLKQNSNYNEALKIIRVLLSRHNLTDIQRKALKNDLVGINEVKNGSITSYENELSPFVDNTETSEISPYPKDTNSFTFGRSVKSESGTVLENLIHTDGTSTTLDINPALGLIGNIQHIQNKAFFSLCMDGECNLYAADLDKKSRLKNVSELKALNSDQGSTTQAYVFKLRSTLLMVFSSNRPGGYGGFDLYFSFLSTNGWQQPKLLSSSVNTIGNEISPYYDGTYLYFSSDYHPNLGGYDIFRTKTSEFIAFDGIENLGTPFNSVANDLYFKLNTTSDEGYLSSNRKGSVVGSSETCCNDIYTFPWPPKKVESKFVAQSNTIKKGSPEYYNGIIDELQALLPLTLYFHNDIPLPNQTVPTYSQTYFPYKAMEKEYLLNNASNENLDFFNTTLALEYSKLQVFTSLVQEVFKSNLDIEFTVKGYASPLATTAYNDALSQRRINSFINELFDFRSGIFNSYRDKISINQVPFGETQSASGVSDNKKDPKKSIYAFEALRERKIEIRDIRIKGKSIEQPTQTITKSDTTKSIDIKSRSSSSMDENNRLDTVIVNNPYPEIFKIAGIEASCGCTEIQSKISEIPGKSSIEIYAKRELYNGVPKPVTIRFVSAYPEAQASFVISLD